MLVDLKDYIENKELQAQLENDEKFKTDVVLNFEERFLLIGKNQSLDKLLEEVVRKEIREKFKT